MSRLIKTPIIQHIQRATIVLIGGSLLVNGLAFIKSLFIASYYGTSAELDAYVLSLAPYRLVSGVLIGVIQATLIPKYIESKERHGDTHALALFWSFFIWILVFLALISGLFLMESETIASYLGAGFSPEQITLTARFLRLSTVFLLLSLLSDLGICLFHANHNFSFVGFSPLLSGTVSLIYLVVFHAQGISALLYSLIVGMTAQFVFIMYNAKRFVPRFPSFLPLHSPEMRETAGMMLPLLLSSSFGYINVTIDQIMASTLPSGSIAALNYATKLHSIFTQMFIMMVSKAILPFLAQQAAARELQALRETFILTVKRVLYVLIPLSLAILVFGKLTIHILFERGEFTAQSTSATSGAWLAYTLGLPVQAVGILTARVYNVLHKNNILMYVAGWSIGLNIFFNWIFMRYWGHTGIALSTSGTYVITTIILVAILRYKFFRDLDTEIYEQG